MKKTVLIIAVLAIGVFAFGQFNDLIISEYIEGSSNNKALEIYNGTGMEVDLSNYVILQNSNGGGMDEYLHWMSGILANEDVYVFANNSAVQPVLDVADSLVTGLCWFNGDDFRGLAKIDPNGLYQVMSPDTVLVNVSIVDMVGMYPDDPGSGWDVAGVSAATANHTLVRKMEVIEGIHSNEEWPAAAGTNADDSQWIVFDIDTFDYLGVHEEIIIDPPSNTIEPGSIVINEIMYNSPGYDNEWVELLNMTSEAINLQGAYILDNDPTHTPIVIPEGYEIPANGYFTILVDDLGDTLTFVPDYNGAGPLSLGNTSDQINLYDETGTLIDNVEYEDGGEWPSACDGDGPSLELISPELDNTLPASWQASLVDLGTPGYENTMPSSSIGWGDLQWPYNIQVVLGDSTETIYGQVWMDGVTYVTGLGAGITAQVGYGANESIPSEEWTWFDTEFNVDAGDNDEYMGVLYGMEEGEFDYTYRYFYEGDTMWYYGTTIGNMTVVAAPPEPVEITFAVDMQYQEVAAEGVHIAGSFQGWDPAATEMFDDDMDMIYTVTLTLMSGDYHEYKFVNGNAWGGDESSNRSFTVPTEDTILPTVLFNNWFPVVDGVFFSEYIEGSSNNKAIEIYNATSETVSLDNFRIAQSSNGGGWAFYHYFPAGAVLEAGDVWVILNSDTDPLLYAAEDADEVLSYPSVVHHNGDDARGLEYSLDGETWTFIDIIGDPDNDPGTGWDVAGVAAATANHTLVRKGFVTAGNTDWAASAGTNADDSQWIVYDQNTFGYLGYHGEAPEFEVTFNVNMNYQIMLQNFDPLVNFVDIGGNFNEWGANALIGEDLDEDGIYTITTMLPLGYNCEFKFRIDGNWDLAEFPGGDNRTYVVVDGENTYDCWFNDEETPEFTTQDVTVTFTLNMEFIDPVNYAGGISIQGSVAPLTWDPGVILLDPARNTYTVDVLFPAGSLYDVEFKFAMLAEGSTEWVWENVGNRLFTIDDTQTTQIVPEQYWNNLVLVTIPEIQTPIDTTDVSPYADQIVTTQGIVTAVASNKYWISTPEGGAWNGMYIYDNVNVPVLGDCIRITGTVSEYYNLTEMFEITGFEVMSSGNDIPAATVLTTYEVANEEAYESVLVMVENVAVTQEANNYGEWYMDDGTGECQADDVMYAVAPLLGDEYASITGIVSFSYGSFELLPRFEEDLVAGPAWIYGDVTADGNVDAFDAANMLQYAVQLDPIAVPLPWTWQLDAGDVDGNGSVEAYDAALVLQYSVDLIDVFPVEELRESSPAAQLEITSENGELVFVAAGELYSAMVEISTDLIETGNPEISSDMMSAVNLETGMFAIASHEVLSGTIATLPYELLESEGSFVVNITVNGVSSQKEINLEDLESNDMISVNEVLGNYPNPFNPVSNIKLAIAADNTEIKVDIYNVKGQLVKTLFQGTKDKGIHILQWNGTDNNGKHAGSGIYFYHTRMGNVSSVNKAIMLK